MEAGDLYRHFKGGLYRYIGVARHSETGKVLVLYMKKDPQNDDERCVWARPYEEFHGMHESGVKRFEKVDKEELT